MRWFLVLVAVMSLIYRPTSDGFPSDDNETALYSANKVVGDILPQGADEPFQRLTNTLTGSDLFTTNSDPSAGDVGFVGSLRRGILSNVLNGDFADGPLYPDAPISDDNPLPYWTWTPAGLGESLRWVPDATYASGYRLDYVAGDPGDSTLSQLVPVPMSRGQQWRVVGSTYGTLAAGAGLSLQFVAIDKVTTIGDAIFRAFVSGSETKVDAGLVPATAAYVQASYVFPGGASGDVDLGEVRVAFIPAEATLGLKSNTANVGAITTTQTQVVGITVPANTFTVGSVYEFDVWGNVTSSAANTVTMRLRVGTTTLTGNIIANVAPTATTTASNNSFHLTGTVTVRTVGASGTIIGGIQFIGQDTQPFTVRLRASQETATVTVNTTVANILEATIVTGGATTSVTVQQASIRCIMAS